MNYARLPRIPWFTRRQLVSRTNQIISTLVRHGFGWLLAQLESRGSASTLRKVLRHSGKSQAEELVAALIALGPTFIKFGQMLGARSDLFPQEYIEAFSRLQDEIPATPFEKIKTVLTAELGREPGEIFAEFDPHPIASASIGQVYAARLWSGESVVVKIVRPGTEETFEQDIEILTDMADWAAQHTALGRLYNLPVLIEEFAHTVRAEFDYYREGRNADIFRENFAGDLAIYVPFIYWDYTTQRVITLERVSGIKINDVAGLDSAGIDRRAIAENLLHFALRQVFEFGLYHADPHAGNFFVQPNASLAVVDFGMVGRLNVHLKHNFLEIASAIERGDADILVDELLNAGIYTRGVDRRGFTRDIERLFENFSSSGVRDLSASGVLGEFFQIILRHGLQLPGELVAMTRAITISEGTANLLYPELKLFEFAAPYMRKFWKDERSPGMVGQRMGRAMMDSMELGLELPRRANRLLNQLERGQMEINLNHQELNDIVAKLQNMTNRITLGMILSAVIIALSLVLVVFQANIWRMLGEYIFGFALISSMVFGLWLVWSIVRSGRS